MRSPPDWSTLTLRLPNEELQPGQSLRMPLWVRAATLGAHSLHFVFCYQPSTPSPALKRRLCPLSAKLRVQPSLEVYPTIRPVGGAAAGSSPEYASPSTCTHHVHSI